MKSFIVLACLLALAWAKPFPGSGPGDYGGAGGAPPPYDGPKSGGPGVGEHDGDEVQKPSGPLIGRPDGHEDGHSGGGSGPLIGGGGHDGAGGAHIEQKPADEHYEGGSEKGDGPKLDGPKPVHGGEDKIDVRGDGPKPIGGGAQYEDGERPGHIEQKGESEHGEVPHVGSSSGGGGSRYRRESEPKPTVAVAVPLPITVPTPVDAAQEPKKDANASSPDGAAVKVSDLAIKAHNETTKAPEANGKVRREAPATTEKPKEEEKPKVEEKIANETKVAETNETTKAPAPATEASVKVRRDVTSEKPKVENETKAAEANGTIIGSPLLPLAPGPVVLNTTPRPTDAQPAVTEEICLKEGRCHPTEMSTRFQCCDANFRNCCTKPILIDS